MDVHDSRWTRRINQSWMHPALQDGLPFLVVPSAELRGSILEWELSLLRQAGYRSIGQVARGALWARA